MEEPIAQLFDPVRAARYLQKHAPDFVRQHSLSSLAITPIKRDVGNGAYHVVIRFDAPSLKDKPLFCSAHSEEDRKNAFWALAFIRARAARDSGAYIPEPLFYDSELQAFFYRGIDGKTLLQLVDEQCSDLDEHVAHIAEWIARLHEIDTTGAENFNPKNSRIKTTIPGPDYFLKKIENKFSEFKSPISSCFNELVARETESIKTLDRQYIIHGDFHPENTIIGDGGVVSIIDFTDICLADWARDVGSFIQQLGFMSIGRQDSEKTTISQQRFLDAYLHSRSLKPTAAMLARIHTYAAWAALRSAVFFLTKGYPEPENAQAVLRDVTYYINKL